MKQKSLPVKQVVSKIRYRAFEDNGGELEMENKHNYSPRTKYLNVKLHHFRDYVTDQEIIIEKIDTKSQLSDYLKKTVTEKILYKLRKLVVGWQYVQLHQFHPDQLSSFF